MLNQDMVLEALKSVKYPGFSRDIVSFGLVKQVSINGDAVSLMLQLTSANPEAARQIKQDSEQAVKALAGVSSVAIQISVAGGQTTTHAGHIGQQARVPGVKRVIAVASGKGGVGKSTCAVNLACAFAYLGAKVGLLDCDIYGPSIPLMMGARERPTVDENEMLVPLTNHGIKLMSIGFLLDGDTPVIWRGPMIVKTIQQFLMQVAWGELDYLFIDLPPGTGDAQLTLCQTVPLDGGIIITTPQEASLGVVRKGMAMFEKVNVPLLGIVENMSYYIAPGGERVEIFGHGGGHLEAARKNVPFLGEVPIYIEIREGGDKGIPVLISNPSQPPAQAFLRIAETLWQQLGD